MSGIVEAHPRPGEAVVAHLLFGVTLVVHHPDGRRSEDRQSAAKGIDDPPSTWIIVWPAKPGEPLISSHGPAQIIRNDKHRLDRRLWHTVERELRQPRRSIAYVVHEQVPYYGRTRLAATAYRIMTPVEGEARP